MEKLGNCPKCFSENVSYQERDKDLRQILKEFGLLMTLIGIVGLVFLGIGIYIKLGYTDDPFLSQMPLYFLLSGAVVLLIPILYFWALLPSRMLLECMACGYKWDKTQVQVSDDSWEPSEITNELPLMVSTEILLNEAQKCNDEVTIPDVSSVSVKAEIPTDATWLELLNSHK